MRDQIKARERQKRHRRKLKVAKFGEEFADADLRGRHQNHRRGSEHPRWNDGRMLSEHGYVKLRVGVDHPLADPNGYAYEHLIVWISAGRPPPRDNQTLHHKDENKRDNRIGNLELLTRGDHNSLHLEAMERDPRTGRLVGKRAAGRLLDGRTWDEVPS